MNISPPNGYTFYNGADAFDCFPDADGAFWFADDFKKPNDDSFFAFFVCRVQNGVTEIVPIPEPISGAGRLNWTPAGLFVSGCYQADPKSPLIPRVFQIPHFKQFTTGFPVVVTNTINGSTIDTTARAAATNALNVANAAKKAADTAKSVADSKPSLDAVWAKVNDRLSGLIEAFFTGNRNDALNARWQDVLFSKTNDWVYGFAKEHGLVK